MKDGNIGSLRNLLGVTRIVLHVGCGKHGRVLNISTLKEGCCVEDWYCIKVSIKSPFTSHQIWYILSELGHIFFPLRKSFLTVLLVDLDPLLNAEAG